MNKQKFFSEGKENKIDIIKFRINLLKINL